MTTEFPVALDDFINPSPAQSQAVARSHSQLHGDLNDAVEAMQRKLGIDNSADEGSVDYLLRTLAAGGVQFTPPGTGALTQAIGAALSNAVSVTWFADRDQLAIDATAATQAAINYAYSSGRGAVYFPGGVTYRYAAASASLDPGVGPILFYGDGEASVIAFDEGTSTDPSVLNHKNLFVSTANVAKGSIAFRDLNFTGTWSSKAYAGNGGSPLMLNYYDTCIISRCKFTNFSSYVMVNEFIKNAIVEGCVFDKNARDNVRFRSSFNVQVIGNRFSHCDDDAVGLHCNIGATGSAIREGIIVAANVFEDCSGIQILSGRMVTVKGNIFRRCKINHIRVYSTAGLASECDNSIFGVAITDNQIFDPLADYPFSAPVSDVITVYSRPAEAGTSSSSIIPGTNIVATGVFELPWNSRNGNYNTTTDGMPPPYFIRIQNNTIVRTLPAVAAYSSWGYGSAYAGDGPHDPAVANASQRPGIGILIGGQLRKAIISGNIVSHVTSCVGFDAEAGSNFGCDDVLITNNTFSDFMGDCIALPSPGAVRTINLWVHANAFDGDPYHLSSNRGAGGSWTADASPAVIACTSYRGIRISSNRVRNVCRLVNNSGGSGVVLRDNVLRCAPAALGFSTSNKGIGNIVEAGVQATYEHVDSDPTSATYGDLVTVLELVQAAMPTSGTYVRGTFIQATSSTTVWGWKRLTTGSAHVSGTDWKTVALT